LKNKKQYESEYEDSADDISADQDMDESTKHEEGEELIHDFVNKFTHLKWEFLRHGVSLAALEYHFPKPLT
jgi:hypothetical protein